MIKVYQHRQNVGVFWGFGENSMSVPTLLMKPGFSKYFRGFSDLPTPLVTSFFILRYDDVIFFLFWLFNQPDLLK